MASQTDNLVVNDDTLGLNRTIDVSSDDLFISVDLTLQSGGVLTADNIKRGTADPNVALVAGNEGDVYQRTLAATGQLWVNTDGTTTGWLQVVLDSSGSLTWAEVLANGNTTSGNDTIWTSGDEIQGEVGASIAGTLTLRAGTASSGTAGGGDVDLIGGTGVGTNSLGGGLTLTAGNSLGTGDGADITLTPGTAGGTGVDGTAIVNGPKHYANSATDPVAGTVSTPAEGDRYYNTTLEMEMRYDDSRSKWLSVAESTLQCSDNGNLSSGAFMQTGNVRMSSTRGWTAQYDGTVVGLGWTRDDSDSMDWAVTADGTTFSTVTSAATSGKDNTLNDDFDEDDILGVRNDGAGTPNDSIVWIRVRWRA